MTIERWLAYVATVFVLMSTPGPSQILMLTNSANYGWRRSILTAFGDLTANVLQMFAAGLGLATVLAANEKTLVVIQWLGIAYLIWLAGKMIVKTNTIEMQHQHSSAQPLLKSLWLQGFITSATNPKAVIFFAALFPQFIVNDTRYLPQLFMLCLTYIVIDGCFLTAYGLGANWITSLLMRDSRLWIQRLGAVSMLVAAALLGLKTI